MSHYDACIFCTLGNDVGFATTVPVSLSNRDLDSPVSGPLPVQQRITGVQVGGVSQPGDIRHRQPVGRDRGRVNVAHVERPFGGGGGEGDNVNEGDLG